MKKGLWLLAVMLCLGVVAWWSQVAPQQIIAEKSRPAVPVTVSETQLRNFQDEASALGTLQAWESVDISASVSQIVTAIGFEDGQQVEKGDILALLKQDAEQASLRELQASLQDARREVRRLENLARKNQVAQTELDKARTQEEISRHQIEEVEARIADRTIIAPFSGVLGLRQISQGALVTPGQRLTTLDDTSRMRLEFSVPATLLAFLRVGQQVLARAPAFEQEFTGSIAAIDSRIDPVARAISARAILENPQSMLRPGLLMEVTIKGAPRQALLIPEESLESRAMQHYVWKIQEEQAVRTQVDIGARVPGWVEITAGLQPGDEVVRDGVGRLRGDRATVSRVEP
jgi:membrane fusion protein (multidrug efflux system)